MSDDTSPENLRKFLESDDPALVRMGISLAKGAGVEVTLKDLEHFLKSENVETIKTGVMLADEAGIGDEAMEMLCKPLEDEDEWVRFYAVGTLGEIGDARAVEPLIRALGEKSSKVSKAVALALVKLALVEPLLKALGEGNLAVVEVLGEIGDVRAVEPLIKTLGDENAEIRTTAVRALGKIGEAAVEPLIRVLEEGEDVRFYAVWALGTIADVRAVEPLIKALEDERVHVAAAAALGNIGDARAVEPLIGVLSDDNKKLRKSAAWALGNIGDARAVDPLIKGLGDEHNKVRIAATFALGIIADVRAVEPLIKALEDEEDDVRGYAAEALGKIGDARAVEPLIGMLSDDNEKFCKSAAWALALIEVRKGEIFTRYGLKPGAAHDALIMALVEIGNVEAICEALEQYRRHLDWEACRHYMEVLAETGHPRAIELILGSTWNSSKDSRWYRQVECAEMWCHAASGIMDSDEYLSTVNFLLDNLGLLYSWIGPHDDLWTIPTGDKVTATIIKVLEKGGGDWPDLIIRILGEIGDKKAIEPITKFLEAEKDIRDAAKEALKKLGHEVQ